MSVFRMRRSAVSASLALIACATFVTLHSQATHAQPNGAGSSYSIEFYSINAGGSTLHGSCYVLSGTIAQAAPGYSSAQIYSLIAGYWQPAPLSATDHIFFNGFEGC